jgi:hypothetical protein
MDTFIILWRSSMCQLELLKLMFLPTESLQDCCNMMIVCISQAIYRSNWCCQCVSFLCAMGISVYLFAHDVNILDIQHQHVQESFSKQKTRSNLANLSLNLICGPISMWMWKLQSFGWDQLFVENLHKCFSLLHFYEPCCCCDAFLTLATELSIMNSRWVEPVLLYLPPILLLSYP